LSVPSTIRSYSAKISITLLESSRSSWSRTSISGLISCTEALALCALLRPMSLWPWITWRCRLLSSTTSKSTMPSVRRRRREVHQRRAAEAAGADGEHLGVLQALLPVHRDVGDDQVAAVAHDLLAGQLRGRLDERRQRHGGSSR
jgi:hypothetical protein